MKMISGVALVATMMLVGGCSDDGGDAMGSGQEVADMIGCSGWSDTSEELYVTEGGRCDLDGEDVGVYYFADQEARDNYVEAASSFGGTYLVGEGWAIDGPPAVLEDLQGEHGGTLSSE